MSRFIDNAAGDEEDSESWSDQEGDSASEVEGEEEQPNELDLAFICDEEDDLPTPQTKTKKIVEDDIVDDNNECRTGIQSPSKEKEVERRPIVSETIITEKPIERPKKKAKTYTQAFSILSSDVLDEALSKGNSAPVVNGKKKQSTASIQSKQSKQSKVVNEDLKSLIKDINSNKDRYDADRKSVVIKLAKYLQRHKTDDF